MCKELGYDGPSDDKHLLEFLENADEREMVMASPRILNASESADENIKFAFGPCFEPYSHANAFITDDIVKMARN